MKTKEPDKKAAKTEESYELEARDALARLRTRQREGRDGAEREGREEREEENEDAK